MFVDQVFGRFLFYHAYLSDFPEFGGLVDMERRYQLVKEAIAPMPSQALGSLEIGVYEKGRTSLPLDYALPRYHWYRTKEYDSGTLVENLWFRVSWQNEIRCESGQDRQYSSLHKVHG